METRPINLMLADDDRDDCFFFKEALEELPISTILMTVNDGAELMQMLSKKENNLPDVLFLDLNMPRKTGYECLIEIKQNYKLKHLPVIIFSTSLDTHTVYRLYEQGAYYYIRKPAEFSNLKNIIWKSLTLISNSDRQLPLKEDFVIRNA